MPNHEIPLTAEEDFDAPEGVEEPDHPDHVPPPPDVETQDPEAPR
jgi:hypothetical protein